VEQKVPPPSMLERVMTEMMELTIAKVPIQHIIIRDNEIHLGGIG